MIYANPMKRSETEQEGASASQLISKRIAELDDWRGETLAKIRALIKAADPEIVEEWKWMGTPVWSHDGIVCTGESYKQVVKMTFAKGAALKDPSRPLQLEPRRQRATSDRHQGGREDQRAGAEGADPRGGGAERFRQEERRLRPPSAERAATELSHRIDEQLVRTGYFDS